MTYFKIDPNKFIKYDESSNSVSIVLKSDIKAQRDALKNVPPVPSDAILLDWAKKNYPGIEQMGRDKEKIAELNQVLAELNAL